MTPSPNTPVSSARTTHNRMKSFAQSGGGSGRVQNQHHEKMYQQQQQSSSHGNYYQHHVKRSFSTAVEKEQRREMIDYFAGAKFDCLPSVSSLPTPPPEWTIPVLRSQSQPSSPVTTGIRIDVNSLFHTPQVIKSSSYAGRTNENMESIFTKRYEESATTSGKSHPNKTAGGEIVAENRKNRGDRRRQNESKNVANNVRKPVAEFEGNGKGRGSGSPKKAEEGIESSKVADIKMKAGCEQPKSMYPDLTEHLRGLLKVQG